MRVDSRAQAEALLDYALSSPEQYERLMVALAAAIEELDAEHDDARATIYRRDAFEALLRGVTTHGCCRKQAPSAGGWVQDGDTWVCPECETTWMRDSDEAQGAWWEPVDAEAPT